MDESRESDRRDNPLLTYRVASMHFRDHHSNLEISRALGISRFRVARLLDQATESGVVDIRIALPSAIDQGLSASVRGLGLTDAVVLDHDGDAGAVRDAVSALALHHISTLLKDGDRLAIAWGRTLDAIATTASHLQVTLPRADVVQIVGGVPSSTGGLEASDLVRRFASLTGGRSLVLNAPLVVPTGEVARGLRKERSVSDTLSAAASADVALFGVGSWSSGPSHLRELLSPVDRDLVARADVAADACGLMVSSSGELIGGDLADRIVGIDASSLKRIQRRVAVVVGVDKSTAVQAVLRAGLPTDLILDRTAALELIRAEGLLAPAS